MARNPDAREPRRDRDIPFDPADLRAELRRETQLLRDEFKEEWRRAVAEGLAGMRDERAADLRGRGRRSGREPLSRDRVVDTAMDLMDKHGLDGVTMRRIAMKLETGPASIYVHVRSMAELHGHMLDRILAGLDLEDTKGSWRERIARLLDRYVALLDAHPELAISAMAARPSGHNYLALVERLLALMAEGGVPDGQRSWGVDLLLLWATAGAVENAERAEVGGLPSDWDALRTAMANGETYPNITKIGIDLVGGTPAQRDRWAIDALLTGIAGTPRA